MVHHIDRLEKVIKTARGDNPRLPADRLADWIILNVKSVTNPLRLITLCELCHDGPLDSEKLVRMAEEAGPLPLPFPDRKHDDPDRSQDRIPGVEVYPAALILTGQVVTVRGTRPAPAAVVGREALGDEEAVYVGVPNGAKYRWDKVAKSALIVLDETEADNDLRLRGGYPKNWEAQDIHLRRWIAGHPRRRVNSNPRIALTVIVGSRPVRLQSRSDAEA